MPIVKKPAVRFPWVTGGINGKLPPERLVAMDNVLTPGVTGARLEPNTYRQWKYLKVMVDEELKRRGLGHLKLTVTSRADAYRWYSVIYAVFMDRMTRWPIPGVVQVPFVTRRYDNQTWYLKVRKSPVAAPEWFDTSDKTWKGGSNHGLGIAVDCAFFDVKSGTIRNIAACGQVPWIVFRDHVEAAGFSWEGSVPTNPQWVPGQSAPRGWEPWHLRNVSPTIPPAVAQLEAFFAAVSKG